MEGSLYILASSSKRKVAAGEYGHIFKNALQECRRCVFRPVYNISLRSLWNYIALDFNFKRPVVA